MAQQVYSAPYTFTTMAGSVGGPGSSDGTNSQARFSKPTGVAIDSAGNLYVADALNETIRRISPIGTNWVVGTLAGLAVSFYTNSGVGSIGTNDGVGSQARFFLGSDDGDLGANCVAVDGAGNVFVADKWNATIRKISPVGTNWMVSTVAGAVGLNGSGGTNDGIGSQARFFFPSGVAVDNAGNVYVRRWLRRFVENLCLTLHET